MRLWMITKLKKIYKRNGFNIKPFNLFLSCHAIKNNRDNIKIHVSPKKFKSISLKRLNNLNNDLKILGYTIKGVHSSYENDLYLNIKRL
jgi:hypothetical protein